MGKSWKRILWAGACAVFLDGTSGCQSGSSYTGDQQKRQKKIAELKPHEKTFLMPADVVWKAAQRALKYPVAVDNIEQGILETDWIRGDEGFVPAHEKKELSSGIRSKITLRILKGKRGQRDVTRVTVSKKLERQRDFFDEGQNLESDGWEEKVLLYRIERELAIDTALNKGAFKRP